MLDGLLVFLSRYKSVEKCTRAHVKSTVRKSAITVRVLWQPSLLAKWHSYPTPDRTLLCFSLHKFFLVSLARTSMCYNCFTAVYLMFIVI